jgi:hypothetical protein
MNRLRFRRILGISVLASTAVLSGCLYGFKGGGGFPTDIRTMYVEPFENQTAQVELDQQLFRRLTDRLPRALGIRLGGEDNADAVITGKITRYDNVGQNYVPGAATPTNSASLNIVTNQVTITVSVQIVDRKRNVVLWESTSLVGRGDYRTTDQQETDGRDIALNHILQQIIDGAQSQW